jgi:hypothetical protein
MTISKLPLVFALLAGLFVSLDGVGAAEKKAPTAKNDPAIEQLNAAYLLIRHGRTHKDPLELLMAARLLHKVPTRPLVELFKDDAEMKKKVEAMLDTEKKESPLNLVAEAKAMTSSKPVADLAKTIEDEINEKSRELTKGPYSAVLVLNPGETQLMSFQFVGGRDSCINSQVLGDDAMMLKASDPKEGLNETQTGINCRVHWLQRETGIVSVLLKNPTPNRMRVYLSIP